MPSTLSIPRIVSRLILLFFAFGACDSSVPGDSSSSNKESTSKQSSDKSTESVDNDDVETESGSSLPSKETAKPETNDGTGEESSESNNGDGTSEAGDSESESSDEEPSFVTLSAKVVDLDSAALSGAIVSMCGPHELGAGCVSDVSADDGTIHLKSPFGPGPYTIAVNPGFDQEGLNFSPVVFSAQLELDVPLELKQAIVFPQTPDPFPLNEEGITEASIDDELTLIANAETFKNPGASGQPYLAGVRLKAEQWPSYNLPLKDEKMLGIWALNPARAFVDVGATPIGIKLSNTYKLPANTEVNFYEVNQAYGELELTAQGIVSEDGMFIETKAGEGVEVISWLVLGALKQN